MKIVLGICTYRRPEELRKLLESLPHLQGMDSLDIVVADNDAGGQGMQVCQSMPDNYPFNISAMSVTTSGISAVRNAVVTKALSLQPDMLVFLDDDEWPEKQWLSELLKVQAQFDADLVGGPTRPVFPEHANPALTDNPYYGADMQLPDGSECQLQAGGNFLIRASVMQHYAPAFFDEAFSHSGSEDLAFFTRLAADGCSMRWAANAIVHEPVPESRLTPDWLKQRVINIHNSRVRVTQHLQPTLSAALIRALKTCALTAAASLLSIVGLVSPAHRHEAQLLRWKLRGKVTAHLGRKTTRGETY